MSYITTADITDSSLKETALSTLLSAKITACDAALEDMAMQKGVDDADDIETAPLGYLVKQWAIAWVCRELCFDLVGKNKADNIEADIYMGKYGEYKKRCSEYESQINYEILTGVADEQRDRPGARTGTLNFG